METSYLDRLSDDQLVSMARHHAAQFDSAWVVSMSTHYKKGRHIDAQVRMNTHYKALGRLVSYVYSHRPHTVWDAVTAAANWQT